MDDKIARYTERLIGEYENICYGYRVKLARPVIRVVELSQRLGYWDPEIRTITISLALIEKFPWHVTLEVLKHEMAHQVVSDHFHADEAHGPRFTDACAMLGVTGWASRATGDIPEGYVNWKDRALGDDEDRLLKRVEKLLALASSDNEHEAALAMQRVQEIYAKHNIERHEAKRADDMVYLFISQKVKRLPRHLSTICSLLNDFFFVRVIHTSEYNPDDQAEYRAVELLGSRENVLMAEYVYYFLIHQLEALWKSYRRKAACSNRSRKSYYSGILSGLREKLQRTQDDIQKTALVLTRDPVLESYVRTRFPRLVSIRQGSYRYDAETYDAGKREGRRLVIHKGIRSEDGFQGRYLPRGK